MDRGNLPETGFELARGQLELFCMSQLSGPIFPTKSKAKPNYISFLFAAGLILATAATPVAAASAVWTAETLLDTNLQSASRVDAAVSPAGKSVVVWDKLIGSDPAHPYGIFQVFAAVRATQTGPWSVTSALSDADAYNAGAVVNPLNGKTTAFWTANGISYAATTSDSGATWTRETIPADAGYSILATVYVQVSPFVDIDGAGNITVILAKPRTGLPNSYDLEAMVKAADGSWSTPVPISGSSGAGLFGSAKLNVLSDGQAFLNFGFTTFRRSAAGVWEAPQSVNVAGFGQVYSASADLDASGRAYFVFRSRYGGALLSTSTPGAAWSKPRHVTKFDTLGGSLQIAASSAGHAMVYGNDMNTGAVRAAASADAGATWGTLFGFGFGDTPQASGSENGQYVLGWSSGGANADRFFAASGTGIGTASAAWFKKNLVGGMAAGSVAIAGQGAGGNAQAAAGWFRWDTANGNVIGASSGLLTP